MTEQTANPTPRPAPKRSSLGQTVVPVVAAAVTSAAVIWSALFYNASNQHASAVANANTARKAVATSTAHPAHAPAPVTTRTS